MKLRRRLSIGQCLVCGVPFADNGPLQTERIRYEAIGVLLNDELQLSHVLAPRGPYCKL